MIVNMVPLYSQDEFDLASGGDLLPLKCKVCTHQFLLSKNRINKALNPGCRGSGDFCSLKCKGKASVTKVQVICKSCGATFLKLPSQIKKSSNNFCSRSCAAKYNNTHKKHGTRRSKLEVWIEQQLTTIYPDLEFHFNCKDTISSELDVYIPALSLAFELNGIYHYEPIHGKNKLNQIINNDHRKFQACLENGIELCIIDASAMCYFKPQHSQGYLDIICNIIDRKLNDTL